MKISFILTTNNNDKIENLKNFFDLIFSYKNQNFEIIIIDNFINNNDGLTSINQYFSCYPNQIQVITNYLALDIATSRNLAISYARGSYLLFVQANDLINEEFFPTIEKIINENKTKIDCVEYRAFYKTKNNSFESIIRIKENTILDIKDKNNKNVFALISPLLTTKLFRKEVITKNHLMFRKPLQFDTFFIYTFLAHTTHFLSVDKILIQAKLNDVVKNDNSFELLSQWVHILNYYNNEKLKKTLNPELEYAYIRYALYTFLNLISTTKNSILIQKTYDYIKEHINRRYKNFRNNPYLNDSANKNDPFPVIVKNLPQYLKKYCHDNQIKDDLRYWE